MPTGKPLGVIMVLPGGGETPERVMNQIYLDELAIAENLIVVFAGFEDGDLKWRPSGNSLTVLQKIWWKNTKFPKIKL